MMYLMRRPDEGRQFVCRVDAEEVAHVRYEQDAQHTIARHPHAWRWDSAGGGYSAIGRTPEEADRLIRELRADHEMLGMRACA